MYFAPPSRRVPASDLGFSFGSFVRRLTAPVRKAESLVKKAPLTALVKKAPLTRLIERAPLTRALKRLPVAPLGPMGLPVPIRRPPNPMSILRAKTGGSRPSGALAPAASPPPTASTVAPLPVGAPAAAVSAGVPSTGTDALTDAAPPPAIASGDGSALPPGLDPGDIDQSAGMDPPNTVADIADNTNVPGMDQPDTPDLYQLPPGIETPLMGPTAVQAAPDEFGDSSDQVNAPASHADATGAAAATPKAKTTLAQKWKNATPTQKSLVVAGGLWLAKALALF